MTAPINQPAGIRPPAIRPLGPFDAQLLAALHEITFTAPWDQAWSITSFAEILAMPGAGGWLLSAADEPRGFILTRQVLDEMEIILIGVDPRHRQQGLAGQLLDFALSEAQRAGIHSVFLEQAAPNQAAGALYARRGFCQVGQRAGYYRGADGRPVDAVVLCCALETPTAR